MWWNLFEIQTRSHIYSSMHYKKHETENYSGDVGKTILSKVGGKENRNKKKKKKPKWKEKKNRRTNI